MPQFSPEQVGPQLLAVVRQILEQSGIRVGHVEIAFDGIQSEDSAYALGHFMHPSPGHEGAHAFNLALAMRSCMLASGFGEFNGMVVRFREDGTVALRAAMLNDEEDEEDE